MKVLIRASSEPQVVGESYTGTSATWDATLKTMSIPLFKDYVYALQSPSVEIVSESDFERGTGIYKDFYYKTTIWEMTNLPAGFESVIKQTLEKSKNKPDTNVRITYNGDIAGYNHVFYTMGAADKKGVLQAISEIYARIVRYTSDDLVGESGPVERYIVVDKSGKQVSDTDFLTEEAAEEWRNDAIEVCLPQFKADSVYERYNRVEIKSTIDITSSKNIQAGIYDEEEDASEYDDYMNSTYTDEQLSDKEAKRIEKFERLYPNTYKYVSTHGIGPGSLPKDVQVLTTADLSGGKCVIYLNRPLTTKELNYYDIRSETGIRGASYKGSDVKRWNDNQAIDYYGYALRWDIGEKVYHIYKPSPDSTSLGTAETEREAFEIIDVDRGVSSAEIVTL